MDDNQNYYTDPNAGNNGGDGGNNMYNYDPNTGSNGGSDQNKNKAIASLVLGIISAVCIFFGYGAIIGIVAGIIGLILGTQAKKENPTLGIAKAGVILSLIALIMCAVSFVACVACAGAIGCAAMMPTNY
ncbi:MAG: hypothetical protein RR540_00755 [Oscillospiraceae bacterium]